MDRRKNKAHAPRGHVFGKKKLGVVIWPGWTRESRLKKSEKVKEKKNARCPGGL